MYRHARLVTTVCSRQYATSRNSRLRLDECFRTLRAIRDSIDPSRDIGSNAGMQSISPISGVNRSIVTYHAAMLAFLKVYRPTALQVCEPRSNGSNICTLVYT